AKARAGLRRWDDLLSIIAAKLTDEPRMDLKVTFDGAARDAKNVRVARAQATALVFALLRREGPKGAKKLADLIEDAFRRDRVPDLDKALGLRPGTAFKWADEAIDAA